MHKFTKKKFSKKSSQNSPHDFQPSQFLSLQYQHFAHMMTTTMMKGKKKEVKKNFLIVKELLETPTHRQSSHFPTQTHASPHFMPHSQNITRPFLGERPFLSLLCFFCEPSRNCCLFIFHPRARIHAQTLREYFILRNGIFFSLLFLCIYAFYW